MGELIIILILIFCNGICSMAEIAMISARKSRLQTEADAGNKQARRALRLSANPDRFLSTVQIAMTLVGILTGLFSGASIAETVAAWLGRLGLSAGAADAVAKFFIVLIVMYFTVLLGEIVPKRIAMSNPEKAAKQVSKPIALFSWITSPLVTLLAKSTNLCTRLLGIKDESHVTEDEIISILQEGADDGEVSPMEQDIVERVFTLGDLSVSTIMTLRDDLVCLDLNMPEEEIIQTIESSIFEQYPVVDGDLDHVEGVLSLKDYVISIRKKGAFNLRRMMKEPVYVHENMSVYAVLEFMKQKQLNRALVCDEFGSLSGIISLKDILDALVGNTGDRHQREPDIVPCEDGWMVDGQCSIYDFLSYFDLDDTMEDFDFSTVGGLVLDELEHVPVSGEEITWQGFRFTVTAMDGARIDRIQVRKLQSDAPADPALLPAEHA